MSDLVAYTVAADLADFFADQIDSVDVPSGCDKPDRIYAAAGEPDVWPCGEIVTWVSAIGATDVPNQDIGIENTDACAAAHYVEVNWRMTYCLTALADPKQPNPPETYETEAACFYSLAYGLYRRLQANYESVFSAQSNCHKVSQGRFELGSRRGNTLSVTQTLRVGVELTAPDSSS